MQELGFILTIVVIIIAVLWICMPFLIMGTNNRLERLLKAKNVEVKNQREVIENQKKILKYLNAINQRKEGKH